MMDVYHADIWPTDSVANAHSNYIHDTATTAYDLAITGTSDVSGYVMDQERRNNMRGLYRITVVNPKTEEIGEPLMVIAKDEAGAMVKAALQGAIKGKVEDYDIIVDRLGDVRAKKDVQRVRMVKGEDEG